MPRLPRPSSLVPASLAALAATLVLLALAGPASAATDTSTQQAAQADVSTHASPGLIAVVVVMTLALFLAGAQMLRRQHVADDPTV